MKKVKVNVRGFKKYVGYSDLIPTYCCELIPSYFVEFPAIREEYFDRQGRLQSMNHGTYFHTQNVEVK